jgi:hypothetical protein
MLSRLSERLSAKKSVNFRKQRKIIFSNLHLVPGLCVPCQRSKNSKKKFIVAIPKRRNSVTENGELKDGNFALKDGNC